MKDNNSMNELMSLVQGLSAQEQQNLIEQIMGMLHKVPESKTIDSCNKMIHDNVGERPDCPHCHAKADEGHVNKRGFKNGVQRFYCKKCNRFFVATTNTAFAHTRKEADVWRKFIYLTITGTSLLKCAQQCDIAYQTAFTWRHKVLNAFFVEQNYADMNGIIEMDEMLLPISYKGNHNKGRFHKKGSKGSAETNAMPRKSYKRGSDNKSKFPRDKVCVFCMVENGNKGFYAKAPGTGFMQNDMLSATVGKHVQKEGSIVLVDEYKITKTYLEKNGYAYKSLISNTSDNYHDHKPQIEGPYHLQHVNAMHRHIRRFLKDYCGVSSKYLNHYLSLYVWIRHMRTKKVNDLENTSVLRVSSTDCYISRRKLEEYPAVPMCA